MSVRYVLFVLHEPRPQAGRQRLWERVTILSGHNQVERCAKLRKRESPISIHITQLPLKEMTHKEYMQNLRMELWNNNNT